MPASHRYPAGFFFTRPVGQVVKTRPFHGCNMGSSPVRVTNGGLAQLVRAPASHAGGHWFESSSLHQKVPDFVRNQELFLFISSNSDAAFWRFSHDPNRDPKAERSGKHRRGADGIIRPSPAVFCGLHGLADDAADGVGGVTFHIRRGVSVGAEGKARVIVSQRTG